MTIRNKYQAKEFRYNGCKLDHNPHIRHLNDKTGSLKIHSEENHTATWKKKCTWQDLKRSQKRLKRIKNSI